MTWVIEFQWLGSGTFNYTSMATAWETSSRVQNRWSSGGKWSLWIRYNAIILLMGAWIQATNWQNVIQGAAKTAKEIKHHEVIFLFFPDYLGQLPTEHVVFYDLQSEVLNCTETLGHVWTANHIVCSCVPLPRSSEMFTYYWSLSLTQSTQSIF